VTLTLAQLGSPERLLDEARSEIGYTEQPAGSNRQKFAKEANHTNGQAWCATFVVAMTRRAGVSIPSESAYTPTMANAFRAEERLFDEPQIGDITFFDFPDSVHRIQHVGLLEGFTDTTVTCVEGNTSAGTAGSQSNGGGVYRRTRPRSHVVGFGRPIFTEVEVTDDEMNRIAELVVEKLSPRKKLDGQPWTLSDVGSDVYKIKLKVGA
jgi:hypothetical protein